MYDVADKCAPAGKATVPVAALGNAEDGELSGPTTGDRKNNCMPLCSAALERTNAWPKPHHPVASNANTALAAFKREAMLHSWNSISDEGTC